MYTLPLMINIIFFHCVLCKLWLAGVECALDLMQRLFGLVVDCSALRCVDIKLSVTNLHISIVKFGRALATCTHADKD